MMRDCSTFRTILTIALIEVSTAGVDQFLVVGSAGVTVEPEATAVVERKQLSPPPETTDGKLGFVLSKLKDTAVHQLHKLLKPPFGPKADESLAEGTYKCKDGACMRLVQYTAGSNLKRLKSQHKTRVKRGNALTRVIAEEPPFTDPPRPLSHIQPLSMDKLYEEKKQAHRDPESDNNPEDGSKISAV